MSDDTYELLVDAVRWIERHAGVNAPQYPRLEDLSRAVNDIARRREPGTARESRPAAPIQKVVVYLVAQDKADTEAFQP